MTFEPPEPTKKTATEVLAALVARRKALAEGASGRPSGGGVRRSERAAAATSAAKSKPAPRKS